MSGFPADGVTAPATPTSAAADAFSTTSVESGSPCVLRDEVMVHSTPHEVTTRSDSLSGRVDTLTLPHCRLVFVRYGGEVTVEAPATSRTVATVPLGPMRVRYGRRGNATIQPRGFLLSRKDRTVMEPDAWAGAWVVAADSTQFAEHRRLVLGAPAPATDRSRETLPLERGEVAEFGGTRLLDDACRQAWALTQLPATTPRPALASIVRAVESNLLTALVLSGASEHPEHESCGDLRIDMLLDWLEANYRHPVTVADMARVTGLSVRQLQAIGLRTLGHSPMAVLRGIRLRRAHEMLRSSHPETSTVTSVALRCGITHAGRFAQRYRAEYGEWPSTTLARRG